MTQQEGMRASRCSSSLLATSVRKSDNPIIFLFSDRGRECCLDFKSTTIRTYQHRLKTLGDFWSGFSALIMRVKLYSPVLNPAWRHLLSSIAGSTFGLMLKRFSAMLVSKSTYMFQIRGGVKFVNSLQNNCVLLSMATKARRFLRFKAVY